MVERGEVKLQYMEIDEQIVDVLTKTLSRTKFENFRKILRVIQNEAPRKRE